VRGSVEGGARREGGGEGVVDDVRPRGVLGAEGLSGWKNESVNLGRGESQEMQRSFRPPPDASTAAPAPPRSGLSPPLRVRSCTTARTCAKGHAGIGGGYLLQLPVVAVDLFGDVGHGAFQPQDLKNKSGGKMRHL
jgi:hypothetical protein